jgi:hypothetical protein
MFDKVLSSSVLPETNARLVNGEKTAKDTVFFSLSPKSSELFLNYTSESSSALL